ncbi:MAG: helix-turn-helix domain-containing protein [Luteimonas sp.]|nr:helix-turn-helix domain-containing protein [Luteimonas sp.]
MPTCPRCKHCWEEQNPMAHDREIEDLRAWCREKDHWVGPGGTVTPAIAAELMERSAETLRDWRGDGRGPPFRKFGGVIRYTLADIAAYRLEK